MVLAQTIMTNFFHASRGENKIKYIIKRGCFLFLKNVFKDIKHRNVLLKHVWYSFSSERFVPGYGWPKHVSG